MKKIILATLFGIGVSFGFGAAADAKIEPVDISCTNPSGQLPGGQQPTCKGNAHEQETEQQNPAGHAPPGHN